MSVIDRERLPQHVGIIMDGNGRWAKQRGLKRTQGHREGARVFRRICEYANDIGIRYITFYAFSTENWARPPEEVSAIMELLREYLFEAEERKKENAARGMRIRFIGSQEGLPGDIISLMNQAQKESSPRRKRLSILPSITAAGRKSCKAYSVLRSRRRWGKSSRRRLRWNKSAAVCIRLGSRTRI